MNSATAEDVKQRLRPFGIFFEKSLKDLIKGIRGNNSSPEQLHKFLENALSECQKEINSPDLNIKTNVILKLAYLEMYGYDMSWANFHILEVMSSNKLQQKRVGYLAASQTFYKDADIAMLATNLVKKDLKYSGVDDTSKVGVALSGLSAIITPSLARDICDDLVGMLNSTRPFIRKRAVTALFKVFLQYPEALRDNFDKFAAKLEDDDSSVLSATVSVICELSKEIPEPFVKLSPILYELLITIENNWIIIRLLKLFTNLSHVEPKLRLKLLPNIIELLQSTTATSVVYESINCIVKGNMIEEDDYETALMCLKRLSEFCSSFDPNLRYISCILFYKIGKINSHFISQYTELVINLLSDVDVSIRSKTLELLRGIASEDNLKQITTILLKQFIDKEIVHNREIIIPETYKSKIIHTLIDIFEMNNYENIPDFSWYNVILYDLSIIARDLADRRILGQKIGQQLKNIMIKVPSIREDTISTIIKIVTDEDVVTTLPSILPDIVFALGEFSSFIDNGDDLIHVLIKIGDDDLDFKSRQILVIALLKIFSNWCNLSTVPIESIKVVLNNLLKYVERMTYVKDFELQERATEIMEFLTICQAALEESTDNQLPMLLSEVLPSFFNKYELTPLSQGIQRQLAQEVTLDFDTPFLSDEKLESIMNEFVENEDDKDQIRELDSDFENDDDFEQLYVKQSEYNVNGEFAEGDNADIDDAATYKGVFERKLVSAIDEEKLSNPFYLTDEQQTTDKQARLLDLDESIPTNGKDDRIQIKLHNKLLDVKRKGKSKKSKNKKVTILTDETLPSIENHRSQVITSSSTTSLKSVNVASNQKNKISLKVRSKLGDFDFSKPAGVSDSIVNDEGIKELEQLRAKFSAQDLQAMDVGQDGSGDEEVIIIKKKKKSKKKKLKKKDDTVQLQD